MKRTHRITKLTTGPMREQIAGVVIHWTMLELTVERVIANLEGRRGTVRFEQNLDRRLKPLKQLAKKKLPKEQAAEIVEIAGEIKALINERNRVVHGLWGLDDKGELTSIYYREKRGNRSRPMNSHDVRQIKLETWDKIRRLRRFEPQALSPVPS